MQARAEKGTDERKGRASQADERDQGAEGGGQEQGPRGETQGPQPKGERDGEGRGIYERDDGRLELVHPSYHRAVNVAAFWSDSLLLSPQCWSFELRSRATHRYAA